MEVTGDLDKTGFSVVMRNKLERRGLKEEWTDKVQKRGTDRSPVSPVWGRGSQTFWSQDPFTHLKKLRVPKSFSLYGLCLLIFSILNIN